ncbi:MAG: FecR domain-containing protein [Spirochaetales bacterium]|nr:FecR domain-containing protein [Spirochaetales bacterium]
MIKTDSLKMRGYTQLFIQPKAWIYTKLQIQPIGQIYTKLFICLVFICFAVPIFAQSSDVDYIEGWVDIKDSSGEIFELFIGDVVSNGETVITGDDGLAELIPESGSRIVIKPGTVFTVGTRTVNGRKQSVLSCALGQVSYKFDRMTGAEPTIATPSMVCGIRGTEFTVLAAADGSSLIVVDSGAVEVESQGATVMLGAQEGVEVKSGQVPGEKFEVLRGKMDFDQWNEGRIEEMLADPLGSLARIGMQMAELIIQMEEYRGFYEERLVILEEYDQKLDELITGGNEEEYQAYFKDTLRPMQVEAADLVLNYRYYALSALALRRHVMTGLYVRMKGQFLGFSGDPMYDQFIRDYQALLDEYETRVVPLLNEDDI